MGEGKVFIPNLNTLIFELDMLLEFVIVKKKAELVEVELKERDMHFADHMYKVKLWYEWDLYGMRVAWLWDESGIKVGLLWDDGTVYVRWDDVPGLESIIELIFCVFCINT